ncbi:MAG TPA: HAD-IA family hydrolase [Candidatus Eisenbacteria bacterium]|nr:HAD-IA family hydrolase [Candidatus Eisenbacteria bacterium]
MRPSLFTFDIFGTVLDWRRGLRDAVTKAGARMDDSTFDRIIDAQAGIESGPFRRYADIVAESLVQVLGLDAAAAAAIGRDAGEWPLFPDSADALRRLRRIAPCAATTNSDLSHGRSVQRSLGFDLDAWICAEDVRAYKPDPRVWRAVSARTGVEPGPGWWHVSAYADYDLATARSLGLTCVFVARPHARPAPADLSVQDLSELADVAESGKIPTGR